MAPELIEGRAPSQRSDQYSAAVILFELLSGEQPFPASETVTGSLHHQLVTPPTPLSEVLSGASMAHEASINRALAKDPADRFPSLAAMVDALTDTRSLPGAPSAKRSSTLIRALALLVVCGLVVAAIRSGTSNRSDPEWNEGTAGQLACNLLTNSGFQQPVLPTNYYLNPDDSISQRQEIVDSGGLADSAALAVGPPGDFGLFGEIVAVDPDSSYVFGAFVDLKDGTLGELRIEWLDADFGLIVDEGSATPLTAGRGLLPGCS